MFIRRHIVFLYALFALAISVFSQTSPYVNVDFELTPTGTYTTANAVSGWSISSRTAYSCSSTATWVGGSNEFSIVATPVIGFPVVGNVPQSPLGGNKIAWLNNTTGNNYQTRLSRNFTVTANYNVLQFAFAAYLENYGHSCCIIPQFQVLIKDCAGNILNSCLNYNLSGCPPAATYSSSTSGSWSNWQTRFINLTAYTGSCVTVEFMVADCGEANHSATVLLDVSSTYQINSCCSFPAGSVSSPPLVSFCPGSSIAQIEAPLGFISYTWIAPAGAAPLAASQTTQQILTVNNPTVGSTFTVNMTAPSGCLYSASVTLINSTVNINNVISYSSCLGGNSGSATALASGSGSGYNYTWISAANNTLSSAATATGLAQGIYTIVVSAMNAPSCGISQRTVAVTSQPPGLTTMAKAFCGSTAFINVPGGSNYQWYNGSSAISAASGGTLSAQTINNPSTGQQYTLRYTSQLGCNDSLQFVLFGKLPPPVFISPLNTVCPGSSNGQVSISITPNIFMSSPTYSTYVTSTGTTTPFSFSSGLLPVNSITLSNLQAGGTYSIHVFDGDCASSNQYTTATIPIHDFSVFPNSATLCPGDAIAAGFSMAQPIQNGQYTFFWQPNVFLSGGINTLKNTIINPIVAPGNSTNIIYTLALTPTVGYCPQSKTISITVFSPVTPSINPIPIICKNSIPFNVTASPGGGIFGINPGFPQAINPLTGLFTPSLAATGTNTLLYTITQGTCTATSSLGVFVSGLSVNYSPAIVCSGRSATIIAQGASSYTWNNGSNNPNLLIAPSTSFTLGLIGFDASSGCMSSYSFTLPVHPVPTISITGNTEICQYQTSRLQAQGAVSYSWGQAVAGPSLSISPQTSTVVQVTGFSASGCESSVNIPINVYPIPTVVTLSSYTACVGELCVFRAYGATSYSWSNGSVSDTIMIKAESPKTYSVTGSNHQGCSNSASISVLTKPVPLLEVSGKREICEGDSITLLAKGYESYVWSNGFTGASLIFKPKVSGIMKLLAVASNSCYGATNITYRVKPSPNVQITSFSAVCLGSSIELTATGADSCVWSNGMSGNKVLLKPKPNDLFGVAGINRNGCMNFKYFSIDVVECEGELAADDYKIYPNPARENITVELTTPTRMKLFDALGRIILENRFDSGRHKISIEKYSVGTYVITLESEGGKTSYYKLIKI